MGWCCSEMSLQSGAYREHFGCSLGFKGKDWSVLGGRGEIGILETKS